MSTVRVKVPAAGADYDVLLEPGLLARAPLLLGERAPATRYAVVSDRNVAGLYARTLLERMHAARLEAQLFVHEHGERAKTRASWAYLTDSMLSAGFGRDSCIIALGGGVTGDLAGFVAATYMRGLPVVQLPTTLLSMVDSSVGGKTGVDTDQGKNLIGAFHPPSLVLIDPLLLHTLPREELCAGAAEVVKHGAIADSAYLERVRTQAQPLLAGDAALLTDVIARSVEIKAEVVSRDPLEQGERASLNFGHTLGHAIERLTEYRVPHGHAVGMGMVAAARIGEALGVTEPGTAAAIAAALAALELPVSPPTDVAWSELLAGAGTDKKARSGQLRFVLLRRIGEVARGPEGGWTHPVDADALSAVLAAS